MNPWLTITADDYENRMSSPEVEQLQELSRLFRDILKLFKPSSLAVIGCAVGNGFEHIEPAISKRVLGVDTNRDYLTALKKKAPTKNTGSEDDRGRCCDLGHSPRNL